MAFRNPHVGMGGTAIEREFELTVTDPDAVRAHHCRGDVSA